MTSTDQQRPDASALLYVGDDEQCEACDWIEENRPDAWGYDWCPFHAGMEEGRAWFARAIAAMNDNPDLANGVLVDHERNQQQEADRKRRDIAFAVFYQHGRTSALASLTQAEDAKRGIDDHYAVHAPATGPAVIAVSQDGTGQWFRYSDGEPIVEADFVFGVAHPSVCTVPLASLNVARYTKEGIDERATVLQEHTEPAEIVVRLTHDDQWFQYSDGEPVKVREL